jgi:hypothetical protein
LKTITILENCNQCHGTDDNRDWHSPMREALSESGLTSKLLYAALYLFVAAMQFEGLDWLGMGISDGSGNFTLSKFAGMIFTFFAFLNFSAWFKRPSGVFIAVSCYFMLVVAIALNNGLLRVDNWYIRLLSPLQFGLMFLILSGLFADNVVRNKCILIYSLSGAVAALLVTLGIGHPEAGIATDMLDSARTTQSNVDPNWFCLQLDFALVGLMGAVSGLMKVQRWLRVVAGMLAVVVCVAIAMSGSRGGILTAAVGLILFCFLPQHRKWRWVLAAAAGVCLFLIVTIALQIPATAARIQMTLDSGYTSGRDTIAEASLDLFRKQPMFGYGSIVAWNVLGESLGLASRDSHNLVIQTALEGGVIGMMIYWSTMAYCGLRIFGQRHEPGAALVAVLFVTLMAGNMGVNYAITKEHWFIISLAVGCIGACARTCQQMTCNPCAGAPCGELVKSQRAQT